jgi:hypothetical protein
MDSLGFLVRNLETARSWTPLSDKEKQQLLQTAAPFAADGHLENYKKA